MIYFWALVIGGGICAIGEILLMKTNMTPARILVLFVVAGAVLTVFGFYDKLVLLAGGGATTPLTGFGYTLVKGVQKSVEESGFLGIFTGGLTAAAAGISAVVFFGYIASLISKPKTKK